ncbi:DUF3488 and transglutaminase-like domain-containing protein [Aeromicrobium sp. Leaf350]|uniref:transglutaminase family protein n=1 Tax=Aeromicrobium sp. Leaf350 TaxID=2876565 RepID=UPI001E287DFB|nr:DUF3488 and transglutaminase-like domain-containing protein [Aeromicrobium sp. Leaf350]
MRRRDGLPLSGRAPVGGSEHLVEHGLLLTTLAVLAGGYVTLLSGTWWWVTIVAVSAAVLVPTAVLRRLGRRGAPVVGLVSVVVVLGWVFAPGSMLLGLIPTPDTVVSLADLLDRAGTIVAEEAPPVDASPGVTLLAAGAFGLVALVGDLLLQRRGGVPLIGVLLVAIYLVPGVVLGDVPSFVVLAVPAALWLVLLQRSATAEVRARNRSATGPGVDGAPSSPWLSTAGAVVGVGAIVLALVLPPVLPDTTALTGVAEDLESGPFQRGVNPMLTLGDDLRRPDRAVALEYTTQGPAPYLSVAMLRDFTGDTWEPVSSDAGGPQEGRADLSEEIDVERQVVEVEIRSLRTSMLPVPYPAVDVRGLEGVWERTNPGLTYSSDDSDTRDQTYSVTTLARQPTLQQLAEAPEDPPERLDPYLELPDDVPQSVTDTAQVVAGDAVGAFAKAQALQDFFRSGAFEYSETAPVDGDYDGNGFDVIERFLEERSGYCVHYSSAMAVMARSVGVPARIMVGYAPGVRQAPGPDTDDDEERYRVTTDQLHAWPQIYVDGVGWVAFEPTPGISDEDEGPDDGPTSSAPAPETTAPQPEPTQATPTPEAADQNEVTTAQQTEQDRRAWAAVVPVMLVLLLLPAAVRGLLRRRRLRASATPDERWREVVATATDLGVEVGPTTTLRAYAVGLFDHVAQEAAPAVERLCLAMEARRYGPPGATAVADDLRADASAVVRSLLATAPAGRRRRARLLPRSLFR